MGNNLNQSSILEGTIEFWISENKVDFQSNEAIQLLQVNPLGGSILIIKDVDRKIKVFHVYIGKGRTDVECDVSTLDKSKKHMIAFTWSVGNKELKLYIDGELKSTATITY
ncbi:MAG: hypothetical protein NT141_04365 [candidate division WWE3 bacterium]|nr:hypothetical protein [candidate division WWE3 bacterium]